MGTVCTDDVTIIVSNEGQLFLVEDAIKRYEAVAGAKLNWENRLACKSAPGGASPCLPAAS